ncbi:hypothetical protein L1O03_07295 [Corynebacterium uropygiale]|uniref:Methionine synthase n=1 Tax=Corynebacterium uropygiale TaxID=1775911 RepID=A0A9X1QSH1_9CORY|nr:hypothetical protein [Corynebacterium uropygiale]MCF4006983.1 hypothetical protein [Corynebacterium uropygiale]
MAEACAPAQLRGTNWLDTADIIGGETGDTRVLPLLPERGIIADAVARTVSLLDGLHAERGPRSWRLSPRPQRLTWAARDLWERDLDGLEELWGSCGGTVTIPLLGPWSLVTRVELAGGHRALTDGGVLRDLPGMYAQAFADLARAAHRRFGARCAILLLEPELSALHAGTVPGTSDFDTIPAIPAPRLTRVLHELLEIVPSGESAPEITLSFGMQQVLWDVAEGCGAHRVDLALRTVWGSRDLDGLGSLLSQGTSLSLALDAAAGEEPQDSARRLARLWRTLGFDPSSLSGDVLLRGRDDAEVSSSAGLVPLLRSLSASAEILSRDAGNLLL